MTHRTSRARRHLYEIERRLDVLEQRIRAVENLRRTLRHSPDVAAQPSSHIEVMQEV